MQATSGSGTKQRSIKDMFGGRGNKGTEGEADIPTQDVVDLAGPSDAVPQVGTPPAEGVSGPSESSPINTSRSGKSSTCDCYI